jgi:hypothetical protein
MQLLPGTNQRAKDNVEELIDEEERGQAALPNLETLNLEGISRRCMRVRILSLL